MEKEIKKLSSKAIKAIEDSIKLWSWLGETGKHKGQRPEWRVNGGTYSPKPAFCFLCGYAHSDCAKCPLWTDGENGLDCEDYAFGLWEGAGTVEEKKKYAKKFVEELRALLPYKGNGNGDTW